MGFVRNDFEQAPGWEEGVVEQMQRLFRPQILARLSVSVPPQVIADADASHSYNRYIVALEEIREVLQAEKMQFYLHLLQTPIKGRISAVLAEMRALSGDERSEFVRVFAKSNATLKEKLQWIE